jgi:hypothetical protein
VELTQIAAQSADFLLSVSLRTLPLFAVAGLVCLGMRRASAASHHLLWAVFSSCPCSAPCSRR